MAAVAHGNDSVAAYACALGAANRRAAKFFAKFLFADFCEPYQRGIHKPLARLELRGGADRALTVPGTNILANVASEYMISQVFPLGKWNQIP